MQYIDKLIESVETGTLYYGIFSDSLNTPFQDIRYAINDQVVWMAYNGSLDAAKSLHEAVLPPINQYTIDSGPSGCGAQIVIWPNGLSGDGELIFNGYDSTPARAWLIAILKAYKSKVQE